MLIFRNWFLHSSRITHPCLSSRLRQYGSTTYIFRFYQSNPPRIVSVILYKKLSWIYFNLVPIETLRDDFKLSQFKLLFPPHTVSWDIVGCWDIMVCDTCPIQRPSSSDREFSAENFDTNISYFQKLDLLPFVRKGQYCSLISVSPPHQ